MNKKTYDFCGWVTKNDLECSDGRVIREDAFADQDGARVPLVWNHNHNDPDCVLGYTILENRPEGVYGYSYLNETEQGKNAKLMVEHGDIDSYSIFANNLQQNNGNVYGGSIKEVSLVLSGANPGAYIEEVSVSHSAESGSEAIIYVGDSSMKNGKYLEHADNAETEEIDDQITIDEILESMTPEQLEATQFLIGAAIAQTKDDIMSELENYDEEADEEEDEEYDEVAHGDDEGETFMKNNHFDTAATLAHAEETIFTTAKKTGSLKDAYQDVLAHADAYGITESLAIGAEGAQEYGTTDPSFLFPEAHNLNNTPEWIKRDMDWVDVVMNGVKHTPFSRVKSQYANITMDEARAKGYVKGNMKKEELFTLLKRVTTPQTIYKKQKLDRDDILDITDFDVVAWIKSEMRMMLNEEIARAILIGDGRSPASEDKISEDHIRPIYNDAPLFVIRKEVAKGSSDAATAKNMIADAVRARKDYKGSGNPKLFTTETWLTEMLLLEDSIGHRLYKTEAELATAMRVSSIVTVPVMENVKGAQSNKPLYGIIVNLADYNVGADKGGAVEMFDDFDIDYNQFKYLIETRCSGAMVKPYSAIILESDTAENSPSQPQQDVG